MQVKNIMNNTTKFSKEDLKITKKHKIRATEDNNGNMAIIVDSDENSISINGSENSIPVSREDFKKINGNMKNYRIKNGKIELKEKDSEENND